ncbi:acetyl/propionyl/methylcrotonyl-CoA carboxylase subunit alpha [Salinifilum ghardaiensis]
MFDTVLVANRGEIAVRVMRTLRRLGIRSVGVYSDADRDAAHVREADVAVHLGPSVAEKSYLDIARLVDAAQRTGAAAVHPGYGFLSENAEFARACEAAGLVFIGPPAEAIDAMGNKIRARETVSAAGVPVVPGYSGAAQDDDRLLAAARDIGFPVLLKPAAGGGGKGMRVVTGEGEWPELIAAARRESEAAFGDATMLLERYVARPRHIEVQVLADAHGTVLHLGERECSLQRRHQKIVEESPSVLLGPEERERIGRSAAEVARAVDYVGAGTVEFVVSAQRPEEFFFLEMNTRLQVEHPVTEMVARFGGDGGIDLVEQQVRIAAGEQLPWWQEQLHLDGHAVEARVYAEVPEQDFVPASGRVHALHEPHGPGVRVDSGIREGSVVGTDYDPMVAKIAGWGADRGEALLRLDSALAETALLGVRTNIAFLRTLLADADVRSGDIDTGLVERVRERSSPPEAPEAVYVAAALERRHAAEPAGSVTDPWSVPSGWRLGEPAWSLWRLSAGEGERRVYVRGRAHDAQVAVETAEYREAGADASANAPATGSEVVPASLAVRGSELLLSLRGRTWRYRWARTEDATWLAADGRQWEIAERDLLTDASAEVGASEGSVVSPMPGTVLTVDVSPGEQVRAGQRLCVVEAMKMEHTISAPFDGLVADVSVRAGDSVRLEQVLGTVKPVEEA